VDGGACGEGRGGRHGGGLPIGSGEGFSGEEKMPSMFSTPKLSLAFSGTVIPVRLFTALEKSLTLYCDTPYLP